MKNKIKAVLLVAVLMMNGVLCNLALADNEIPENTSVLVYEQNGFTGESEEVVLQKEMVVKSSIAKTFEVLQQQWDKLAAETSKFGELVTYFKENEFTTLESIHAYEAMWQEIADEVATVENKLVEHMPLVQQQYEELWTELYKCVSEAVTWLQMGTNMNHNNDNTYTGEELVLVTKKAGTGFTSCIEKAETILLKINAVPQEIENETSATKEENIGQQEVTEVVGSNVSTTSQTFSSEANISNVSDDYSELNPEELVRLISNAQAALDKYETTGKEKALYDREGFLVSIDRIDYESDYDRFVLHLMMVNNTSAEASFYFKDVAINGWQVETRYNNSLMPNAKSRNGYIRIEKICQLAGLQTFEEIEVIEAYGVARVGNEYYRTHCIMTYDAVDGLKIVASEYIN